MSEGVFDVVSKDPQVPTVSDQMELTAKKKHRREVRQDYRQQRLPRTRPLEYICRHDTETEQKGFDVGSE